SLVADSYNGATSHPFYASGGYTHANGIDYTESGNLDTGVGVWTGTNAQGTKQMAPGPDPFCTDWTSDDTGVDDLGSGQGSGGCGTSAGSGSGIVGLSTFGNSSWTFGNYPDCNSCNSIYCVQQ